MRYTLNWRYILKLTAVLAVAGVATHFAHRWQVRRQVGIYLQHADTARDAGDRQREAQFLQRYVIFRGDDLDVRERYVRLVCSLAKSPKQRLNGFLLVEDLVRRAPDSKQDELRRFAIDLAMDPQSSLYTEAEAHIDFLLVKHPADGELMGLKAKCLAAAGKYDKAVEVYAEATRHRPDLVESYAGRAAVLRLQLKQPDEADQAIAEMVTAQGGKNLGNARTHLILAEYWRAFGSPGQEVAVVAPAVAKALQLAPEDTASHATRKAVAEARRIAPDDQDVLLAAASLAREDGLAKSREGKREERDAKLAEARDLLDRARQKYPKSPAVYLSLASLAAETKGPSEAVEVVRSGLKPDAARDSPELALALLDYQIRAGDTDGARETLTKLEASGLPPARADYHKAQILVVREEKGESKAEGEGDKDRWTRAAEYLERVRQEAVNDAGLVRQANLLLGRCYAQRGENDRRLEAFTRAVPVDSSDPLWVPAVLGVAESEAALGRAEAALVTYRKLKDRAPGAWVAIARLEMIQALGTDGDKRDWSRAEQALTYAERVLPDSTEVLLLRADLTHYQGRPSDARQKLEDLRAKRPNEFAVWAALAIQELRDGNPQQAATTLDAAEQKIGDSPELRLARARLLAATKDADLAGKLNSLATRLEGFNPAQQQRLLRELAEIATAAGATDAARPLWERVAEVRPFDLGVHLTRFDLAARAGDGDAMDVALAGIRKANGNEGQLARMAQALRWIRAAQDGSGEEKNLDHAIALLEDLGRERAGWARVFLARAVAHDLKSKLAGQRNDADRKKHHDDAALANYQRAEAGGESPPEALYRQVMLLRAQGHQSEADRVFLKIPTRAITDPDAQRLAAEVALRTNNSQQAVEFATRAIPADSKDPRDHLLLGLAHHAAGDRTKAAAAFRRAAELRPESPDGWLDLVQYLALTKGKADAEEVVAQAEGKVNAADRPLFLAKAYAATGQADKAVEAFKQARAARPEDLRTIQAQGEFLLQLGGDNLPKAQEAFEAVINHQSSSDEDKARARRLLATTFAVNPDYETSRRSLEVLGLVDKGGHRIPADGSETPAQKRDRATVLALQRDRDSRLEAIRILEGLQDGLTVNEQYLLARLYLAVGDRNQFRVAMATLLRRADRSPGYPGYLSTYIAFLLRDGDTDAAEQHFQRLEKLQPEALVTAELKARLAAARKDVAAARRALLPRAEAAGAPVARIAQVFEEIGLYDDAERLFRRVVDANKADRPQAVLVMAAFYGRRGRTTEALRVCEAARGTVAAPLVTRVAVEALYNSAGTPPAAEVAKVVRWLEEAVAKAQGNERAALSQHLASVRSLQKDYPSSIQLYRTAVAANGKDGLSMNNLAFLLSAYEKKHDEALGLLERAKRAIGPSPDLIDTEAIVRLNKGEPDAAHRILEQVVAQAPTGTAYFHLAQAEAARKRDLEARNAWRKAGEHGFKRADLHPLEWPAYDQLAAVMK